LIDGAVLPEWYTNAAKPASDRRARGGEASMHAPDEQPSILPPLPRRRALSRHRLLLNRLLLLLPVQNHRCEREHGDGD
jgi:hypothetical protein